MNATITPGAGDVLQFDRAVPATGADVPRASAHAVQCASCSAALAQQYFDAGGTPVCAACKATLEQQAAPLREWKPMLRAILFGLGASIVGAGLYYGVIAITDFEIGLIAIATGYMVGWAVRRGARGRGGRRLQIVAVALTYASVAMAYTPLALFGPGEETVEEVSADTAYTVALTGAPAAEASEFADPEASEFADPVASDPTLLDAAGAIGIVLGFVLVLPLLVVFGTMPTGLISAAIIGFGMHQAWRMTGADTLVVSGPYAVGTPESQAEAREPGDAAPAV
ncbi:MAG TPA: hypothetical protein VFT96_06435 [Gemmatimonadaceae bacterium]|nr:hypothetical protein [Gemmatimonadaceae bacterium]